ncbi:MAG TPA: prepilin-type N-terminal cleavage/methylation domain-containing protein [Gammaproteobacteria bacterium]|nr:prepilin-type N-terminal cleavage/methylation domain-containing protein [Gammaproteobacteria bacterium]
MSGDRLRAAGFTLLELIVSMAVALVLVLAVATLHARILYMSADTARAADAQDTVRIGLAILEHELRHAGFWGLVPEAARIAGRQGDAEPLDVSVAGDCGPGWALDLDRFIEAWAGGWPLDCTPFGGVPPAGALLVLRRADTRLASPEPGVLQVQSDPWSGRLDVVGGTPDAGADVRDLVARAYYVSPRSTGDPTRPSLRRKTLQRGPRVVDEEVVPGIADLVVELGVDTDVVDAPGYGQVNRFVPPGDAVGRIRAIRVTLRADDPAQLSATRTIVLHNGDGS